MSDKYFQNFSQLVSAVIRPKPKQISGGHHVIPPRYTNWIIAPPKFYTFIRFITTQNVRTVYYDSVE
jgi:hypothetical protein